MKAAQLTGFRKDFEIGEVPEPEITAPTDVIVAGRCRGLLPHGHPHLGRPVRRGLEGCRHRAAVHPRPREGGLGARGRAAAVNHVSVGDAVLLHPLATCGYCHFLPGRRRHALHRQFLPRDLRARRLRRARQDQRPRVVPLPDGVTPVDVGPLACAGHDRLRRGQEGPAAAYPGSYTVALGRRRSGPHRHPGAARAVPDRDHRGRPLAAGAGARPRLGRRPDRAGPGRTARTWQECGT